jgi:hypothetical protein
MALRVTSLLGKCAFCSDLFVPARWSRGHGRAREKRFGFPGVWAQSSLAEIRLLSRKRAELEDFINRGRRCQERSSGTTTARTTRHG